MRLAALALLTLSLAACDDLVAPERTNPYDPAFDGERIASPPTDLRLTDATGTSVTLTWTDGSSFDTGFRIEAAGLPDLDAFETVAVVPADVFSFTERGLTGTRRRYRVVALGPTGGRESRPGDVLTVRYPVLPSDTVAVAVSLPGLAASQPRLRGDGGQLYAGLDGGLGAIDTRTGAVVWRYPGASVLLDILDGGRLVTARPATPGQLHVLDSAGRLERTVTLDSFPPTCADLRVSGDGQRAAGTCGREAISVWDLGNGRLLQTVGASARRVLRLDRFDRTVYATLDDGRLAAFDAESGERRWVRPDPLQSEEITASPDGRRLLVGEARAVRTVSTATGAAVASQRTARPQRPAGFSASSAFVAYADGADRDGIDLDGVDNLVVARAGDLGTVRWLYRASPVGLQFVLATVTPTGDGAVALVSEGSERYAFVRWDLARPWVAEGSPAALASAGS